MEKKVIYLIRHGEIYTSGEKTYIGISDIPLSIKGIDQAKKLRAYFSNIHIDKIYSSDLKRNIQTSDMIVENRNLQVIKLKELREINMGSWEGKTFTEIRAKYPEDFKNRIKNIEGFKPEEGESFTECKKRAVAIFNKITKMEGKNILIVAHAGINRVIIADILEIPLKNIFKLKQNYGCINKISFYRNEYKIEYINNVIN